MSRKILIDASYKDEIRLVVVDNGLVIAFEYQGREKRSIKGNIYLAKVTRIEPSLQAAFVEYGAEKQGFLPFEDIHCEYYQLPAAEKKELIESTNKVKSQQEDSACSKTDILLKPVVHHKYKIQDVIKKDQVLLVQALKEERGNKGASMTTYITLSGRYCIVMPNAAQSIGVSRKISDTDERERLKRLAYELHEQNNNLSVIIRTAGEYRAKIDIKRDFGYLKKLWNSIKSHASSASTPAFIYEESNVVRKAIRDFYSVEVDEIVVSGNEVYENALEFMSGILPKYIGKLKQYQDNVPIFAKYKVEEQLASLYDNRVSLHSGGYIVINQAEALVAIDVNSGKSTAERSVENTALKTNLEAATEIAVQLRLRDLSGLIVIDFIDMNEFDHRKAVERAIKDATAHDRARVQIGKISEFGLLEMSRQHLKQSFTETHLLECSYCSGRGSIRPLNATAIAILRAIEGEITEEQCQTIEVMTSRDLAIHLLNTKRREILSIEQKYNINVHVQIDESAGADGFFIERKVNNIKQAGPMSFLDYSTPQIEAINVEETENKQNLGEKSKKKGPKKSKINPNKYSNNPQNSDSTARVIEEAQDKVNTITEIENSSDSSNNKAVVGKIVDKRNRDRRRKFLPRPQYQAGNRYKPHGMAEADVSKRSTENVITTDDSSLLKKIWKKIIE